MFVEFKHKTAYELSISDWSSDVCSSDHRFLPTNRPERQGRRRSLRVQRPRQLGFPFLLRRPDGLSSYLPGRASEAAPCAERGTAKNCRHRLPADSAASLA